MIAGLVQNGDCEFVALVERRIDRKTGREAYSFSFSLRPQTLVDSVNLMPHQPLASRSPRLVNPSSPRSCRSVPSLVPSRCRPSRPASVSRSRTCSGQHTLLEMARSTARILTFDLYHFTIFISRCVLWCRQFVHLHGRSRCRNLGHDHLGTSHDRSFDHRLRCRSSFPPRSPLPSRVQSQASPWSHYWYLPAHGHCRNVSFRLVIELCP